MAGKPGGGRGIGHSNPTGRSRSGFLRGNDACGQLSGRVWSLAGFRALVRHRPALPILALEAVGAVPERWGAGAIVLVVDHHARHDGCLSATGVAFYGLHMGIERFELSRPKPLPPQDSVSASSTISPSGSYYTGDGRHRQAIPAAYSPASTKRTAAGATAGARSSRLEHGPRRCRSPLRWRVRRWEPPTRPA